MNFSIAIICWNSFIICLFHRCRFCWVCLCSSVCVCVCVCACVCVCVCVLLLGYMSVCALSESDVDTNNDATTTTLSSKLMVLKQVWRDFRECAPSHCVCALNPAACYTLSTYTLYSYIVMPYTVYIFSFCSSYIPDHVYLEDVSADNLLCL